MKVTYPSAGAVSVWVGNFESEDDFDRCTDGPITKALGLKTDLASVCEIAYEDEAVPVRKLIEGFSGWESFVEHAEKAAKARGVTTANAVLVCYYVKCEDAPAVWDKMHFLGSFAGQDVA